MKVTAIVLAAGKGSRMGSGQKKQYMLLAGLPLVVHSLRAFQGCGAVNRIILVCGQGETEWCRDALLKGRGLDKVQGIVEGGRERYHSVWEGLRAATAPDPDQIVLIHDGARPLVSDAVIRRVIAMTEQKGSCVAAVPVKDTIKMVDDRGQVIHTPDRASLRIIQTPQGFFYREICDAYRAMFARMQDPEQASRIPPITDDAMVMETFGGIPVFTGEGDYRNIKVTTPEDLLIAEALMNCQSSEDPVIRE